MLEVEGFRLLLWPGTQRPMVRSQPTVGAQFVQFNPPGQSLFVKAALSSQFQVYSVIGGSLKFDRAVIDLRNEAKKEGLCYTVDLWIIESQLHLERTDVIITWLVGI